jgi:hypothetical protein
MATDGSIRRLLEKPPTLRHAGFDLETGDQAQTVDAEKVRVANGDRKILELYRDGTFVFACRADDWFLAWASQRGQQKINPLALVEVIYSFADFYGHVIRDLKQPPTEIRLRIDLRNMHDRGVRTLLGPYGANSKAQEFGHDLREAPQNDWTITRSMPAANYDPAVTAYVLVREIYLWFGIDEDTIPYVKTEGGSAVVDVEAIRKIK